MPSSSTVMAPSSTSSARSRRSYLDARDSRQDALAWALGRGHPATLFLALNIPGGDKTPPGAEALPALWWADQMRLRQHQLVSNTGQIPKVQRVPPPHPSAPRRRDPFEPEPAPSSRAPVHESGEIPREIDPDQAQLIHRRDRDRALDGAPPPADTRKKSRG